MLVPGRGFKRPRGLQHNVCAFDPEPPTEAQHGVDPQSCPDVVGNTEIAVCRPLHGAPRRPRRHIEQRRADAQPAKRMREVTEKREGVDLELFAATQIVVRADKLNPSHQRFVATHRILDERRAHREITSLRQTANRRWVDISSIVDYHSPLNAMQPERQLHTPSLAALFESPNRGYEPGRRPRAKLFLACGPPTRFVRHRAMIHSETGISLPTISLSGVATRAEDVVRIASKLGDDALARKLERAVANHNTIVALTLEDRQRLLDVLEPETGFVELRNTLRSQIQKYAEHQRRTEQMRKSRERLERRNAPPS